MRYGQIRQYDVANGPGVRSSIFVTGCSFNCPGCFNQEYQDPEYGDLWTQEETDLLIQYLKSPQIRGLSILGGEPFQNTQDLYDLVLQIRREVETNIWIYSGYQYESLVKNPEQKRLLELSDVLVDGLFVEELKDLTLAFKGSSNQRIIDIGKSLAIGTAVEFEL